MVTKGLVQQIRAQVRGCGMSAYYLSEKTGIDRAALHRFMRGTRGLSMESLDRLGDALNLVVTVAGAGPRVTVTSARQAVETENREQAVDVAGRRADNLPC